MKNKETKKRSITSLKVINKKQLTTMLGGATQNMEQSLAPEKFSSLFSDIEHDGGFSSLFHDDDV